MGKLFDLESPLFSFLNKFADLVYLNILTMICCIPIVTIGASMTALNYVVLKMVRNEEGYITRSFFRSFKQNFKQATLIWVILLLITGILVGDAFILNYSTVAFPSWFRLALAIVAFIMLFATMHIFPVLAKFENSIKQTFKNSLFMGILSLPKTILMMVCWAVPVIILIFFFQAFPVVFLLGISGPAFVCALLYNKTFKRFEPEENIDDGAWSSESEEETDNMDASAESEEKPE